jgi:hypothetical protein
MPLALQSGTPLQGDPERQWMGMEHPHSTSAPVLSAGIDWITATARPGASADQLAALAGRLVSMERESGNQQREWRWRDYRGLSAGGAAYGSRRDGLIVRASGAVAAEWVIAIATLATAFSRLDMQVTWVDAGRDADAGVMRLWRERRPRGERGRPTERTIIRPEIGGPTIYAGSRASEQFGRIYDKHKEMPGVYEKGSIRAEVEYKGALAEAAREEAARGALGADRIVSLAGRWFRRRGFGIPLPRTADVDIQRPARPPTDAATTLRWLETQVTPAVARSIGWVGLARTLTALGLSERVAPSSASTKR